MTEFAWESLRFRYPFRKYQRMILAEIEEVLDTPRDDRRYHIVAPPGAGKTIVELTENEIGKTIKKSWEIIKKY
jgi:superfamily II DNA or RNA helicase